MSAQQTPTTLAAALALAADGFAVFPCHTLTAAGSCSCGKPKCADVAKHPATPHGLKDASTDGAVIRAAWGASDYNVAVATGMISGVVVIDIDLRGGEIAAARALFPPTRAARTGSGGLHLYYRHPGGAKVPNSTKKVAPGCDVRGDGGYVIAPPSLHRSTGSYTWEDVSVPMADVPEELLLVMRRRGPRSPVPTTAPAPLRRRAPTAGDTQPRRYALAALDGACRDLQAEPKGARHGLAYNKAFKVGGYVGASLLAEHEAEARLLHATRAGGWDAEREPNTLKAIRDGLREGATKPLAVPEATVTRTSRVTPAAVDADEREAIQGEPTTPTTSLLAQVRDLVLPGEVPFDRGTSLTSDIANAARLAAWHGENLRYCDAIGGWYAWDGKRWAQDAAAAWRCAEDTARRLMQTASDKDARKHAERSQNVGGIDAMLRAARNRVGIITAPSDFDANAYVLNVANGLLDLRTGELRSHDRGALCRKITPALWEGFDAKHPILDRFLAYACELHDGLLDFVARMAGLALIGENPYEAFFVAHGPPGSGKSTLIDALKAVMGDYAVTAAVETFLANDARRASGAEATPDIARLAGTRLVLCSETKRKARLDEALIKRVTSDKMVGRMLHKDPFEFDITFKIILATNYPPGIDPSEHAIWRRLYLVPLDRPVPVEDRDPAVKAAMSDAAIVGPALLALAMRGCLALQERLPRADGSPGVPLGLAAPPCVREATDAYRAAQDPLKDFLEDACVLFDTHGEPLPVDEATRRTLFDEDGVWSTLSELRGAYERWAKEQGQNMLLGPRAFGAALTAHGCVTAPRYMPASKTNVRTWYGVRLRRASDDSALGYPAQH
jgi:putative DNA primase/helicase